MSPSSLDVELSPDTLRAVLAQYSDRELCECLTFSSDSETLRYINRASGIDRLVNGELVTFKQYWFQLALHNDEEDQLPRATVIIDATDQTIIEVLMELTTQPDVIMEVVAIVGTEAVVDYGPVRFKLVAFETDGATDIRLTLGFLAEHLVAQYPKGVFSPSNEGDDAGIVSRFGGTADA
jgi:hypothetical protein